MTKLFNLFKNISRLVVIIGLLVIAGVYLVLGVTGFGDRFFSFISDGFSLLFLVCLYALPAVLLLLKKDDVAKFFLFVLLAYVIINWIGNYVGVGYMINSNYPAMTVVYGVFCFLHGLLLLTCAVFFVLCKAFNLKLYKILNLLVVIALGFFVVVFLVTFITYIVNDAGWVSIVQSIFEVLLLPFVVFCALLPYQDAKVEEKQAEEKKEEKEEASAEEEKEETPAEEKTEEQPVEQAQE
ncbi:MAG: hypothetical protein K6E74_03955 [Bacilli bacterium]|nr:hypothetical protein [Bacilli bacterium]